MYKTEELELLQAMPTIIYGTTRKVHRMNGIIYKTGNTELLKKEYLIYSSNKEKFPFLEEVVFDEIKNVTSQKEIMPLPALIESNLNNIPEYYLYKIAKNAGFSRKDVKESGEINDWRVIENFTVTFDVYDDLFCQLLMILDIKVPYRLKESIDELCKIADLKKCEVILIDNWGIDANRNLKLFDYGT